VHHNPLRRKRAKLLYVSVNFARPPNFGGEPPNGFLWLLFGPAVACLSGKKSPPIPTMEVGCYEITPFETVGAARLLSGWPGTPPRAGCAGAAARIAGSGRTSQPSDEPNPPQSQPSKFVVGRCKVQGTM